MEDVINEAVTSVATNTIDVETLFQHYHQLNFIYPKKSEFLAPHLNTIKQNIAKATQSGSSVAKLFTSVDASQFATSAYLKLLPHTALGHQVTGTSGYYLGMLATMLACEYAILDDGFEYCMNFFRESNRWARKMFADQCMLLSEELITIKRFGYYLVPKKTQLSSAAKPFRIVQCHHDNQQKMVGFVKEIYGNLYVEGENLNIVDFECEQLNQEYQAVGCFRRRKVLVVLNENEDVLGVALIDRASLGLNLSFLANKLTLLIQCECSAADISNTIKSLVMASMPYYEDFEPPFIPVLIDAHFDQEMALLGLQKTREYAQTIWARAAFLDWCENIKDKYRKLLARTLSTEETS